jgi:hypothetical protein
MTLMVIQHKVHDYDAWRSVHDALQTSRTGAGVTFSCVYRNAEDPNDLLVLHDVANVAKARAWTTGEDLRTAMAQSGVIGEPAIYFVD